MMRSILKNKPFRLFMLILIVLIVITAGIAIHRSRNTKLLDKEAFASFRESYDQKAAQEEGGFSDQEAVSSFIKEWADSNSLKYTEDKYGNLIFDRSAVSRKKQVTPTLIAVGMNSGTASGDSGVLAIAASVALSDIDSGRRTVVFFNDEKALAKGYKGIKKNYISSDTKVIFLDRGASTYLSDRSFRQDISKISVPAELTDSHYDTAIKISISGIDSGIIGPGLSKRPDPFSALSTILTRLKTKSIDYGISELSIGSNGNMYPVSVDVTIALNSYNTSSLSSYLDKRIKDWDKNYGDKNAGLVYSYEIIDKKEDLPDTVYSPESCDRLTGILYTIQSTAYTYSENDPLPDGKEAGDIYGFNCLTALETHKNSIDIFAVTQGYDDLFTDRILNDNKAAAELYDCRIEKVDHTDAFNNEKESLSLTFTKTFNRVNENSASENKLSVKSDNSFTPCSYLAEKNGKADIVHISVKKSSAARVANTILCYIKSKGNISFFK